MPFAPHTTIPPHFTSSHPHFGTPRQVGTKLLSYEVRISMRLAFKAARGNSLSRRERQQLTRTTADVFRLVPMLVILVSAASSEKPAQSY